MTTLKKIWDFVINAGSLLLSNWMVQLVVIMTFGYIALVILSLGFAYAVYPILPSGIVGYIKSAQQREAGMSYEFWVSTPERYLAIWFQITVMAAGIVAFVSRGILSRLFKVQDVLEKTRATEAEVKGLREEMKQMRDVLARAGRNTPP